MRSIVTLLLGVMFCLAVGCTGETAPTAPAPAPGAAGTADVQVPADDAGAAEGESDE